MTISLNVSTKLFQKRIYVNDWALKFVFMINVFYFINFFYKSCNVYNVYEKDYYEMVNLITLKIQILTLSIRNSTTLTWSNKAALWSGVILRTSSVCRAMSNLSDWASFINLTMSILPWALAKWSGVELSS